MGKAKRTLVLSLRRRCPMRAHPEATFLVCKYKSIYSCICILDNFSAKKQFFENPELRKLAR